MTSEAAGVLTDPTVDGAAAAAGTGASLTLIPPSASAASGNPAGTGPVAEPSGASPSDRARLP
jgi:hypothetical protein